MACVVTVVIPVYNGEQFLVHSVRSVLAQTYGDLEVVVVDDGSTDSTGAVADQLAKEDARVRVLHPEHRGLVAALNVGLQAAHGEFVARLDSDDTCLPIRLERQLGYLLDHPEIGIVGSGARMCGSSSGLKRPENLEHDDIRCAMLFRNQLLHPTVMLRWSAAMRSEFVYRDAYPSAEDWDLWVRASRRVRVANTPEPLIGHRIHPAQKSKSDEADSEAHWAEQSGIVRDQLSWLNVSPKAADMVVHRSLAVRGSTTNVSDFVACTNWLRKIMVSNSACGEFDANALARRAAIEMWEMCERSSYVGPELYRAALASGLDLHGPDIDARRHLARAKCVLRYRRGGGDPLSRLLRTVSHLLRR